MGLKRRILRGLRQLTDTQKFPPNSVHFLHVGKAAGTRIGQIIDQVNQSNPAKPVVQHGHAIGLSDLPPDADYFFSTRDPITRFKSGFYSRLRKGQPRNFVEWSKYEAPSFERFPHANDLAEALFLPGQDGQDATAAMRSIRHPSRNLVDWFRFCGHMFDVRPPVWIIRQEHLQSDLEVFLKRIGYDGPLADEARSKDHTNDYENIPELSPLAQENLRRWYVQDYAFIDMCETWMNRSAETK